MGTRLAYNDYIIRVPRGEDVSPLYSLAQSMGWDVMPQLRRCKVPNLLQRKGLSSLRGILKIDKDILDEDLRREAVNAKYGIDL